MLKNQKKNLLGRKANLDTKVFCCLPVNPSLGTQTPALPHSKPKLFACHFRNLQPVRGTGRLGCSQLSLFSESQQLPLPSSFSPAPSSSCPLNIWLVPRRPWASWLSVSSEGLMLTPHYHGSRSYPSPSSIALHFYSWGSPCRPGLQT